MKHVCLGLWDCSSCFCLIILHFTMKPVVSVLWSAASFWPNVTKVNGFSCLRRLSISRRPIFSPSVCPVICVCLEIVVFVTSPLNPAAATTLILGQARFCVTALCVLLRIGGDFLSPPAVDAPINKQLSSSSAALHSPERGEKIKCRVYLTNLKLGDQSFRSSKHHLQACEDVGYAFTWTGN